MSAVNVPVSVSDPDQLIAGLSDFAPFAVAYIQLYRYASEANARADASSSLATTFTLVSSDTTPGDPDITGPFRFGYYDASATAASWYRYRFADVALAEFSLLSEPWPIRRQAGVALRDILFEVGDLIGGSIIKKTAETNATANLVKVTSLFKSTAKDARIHENWWVFCSQDAGGLAAAPEGEEAAITSVDTATGIATLERDLTAAITANDIVLVSAFIQPTELIRVINRVRETMEFIETIDIALTTGENRYPAPWGVKAESDVIDGVGIVQYTNSNREDEFEIGYKVVFDGFNAWIEFDELGLSTRIARLRVLRNYRDAEGPLALMSDTTRAPIEWLRPAAALAMVDWLSESEADPEFQRLRSDLEPKARRATGKYAPEVIRRVKTGGGRKGLPGPSQACP